MGHIFNKDFSAGYIPADDYLNGRPNGQLRMDGLCLDETGALVLSRAPKAVNNTQVQNQMMAVYSKYLNGTRYRFFQRQDLSIWCDRDQSGNYSYNINGNFLDEGAGPLPAAFGAGFGRIFISNGSQKDNKEFDGTNQWLWGFDSTWQLLAPQIAYVQAVCCPFYGGDPNNFANLTAFEGTLVSSGNGIVTFKTSTGASKRANIRYSTTLNLNDFINSADIGAPTDNFYLVVNWPNSGITSVEVRACASTATDSSNYYSYSWPTSAFANNYNRWSLLTCKRSDFTKFGTVDWSSIAMTVMLLVSVNAGETFSINVPYEFYNANESYSNIEAGLDGGSPITYYQQLLTKLEGTSGKSPLGPPSRPVFGKWSAVGIIPIDPNTTVPVGSRDPRIYEIDIYKTGGLLSGDYYFIGSFMIPGGPGVIWDTMSAVETLAQDITAAGANYLSNIPGGILAIEGPVNGRMVLMTSSGLQFTDFMNPEAIDDRLTIIPSNSADETCLFVTKSSNTVITLATTQDFYEISGTWAELDNGVFDIFNRSAGIKQPAISIAHCIFDNAIIYVAAGGLRQLGGSVSQILSQELTKLFKGEDCNGVLGFIIGTNDTDYNGLRWALAASHQKIYFRVTHRDSTASMFIYDINRQSWYRRTDKSTVNNLSLTANCLYTEEDGSVFSGFNDGYVRIYESSDLHVIDGSYSQDIYYQSICHATETPQSRKDLFTLKLWMQSGGSNINVILQDEFKRQYTWNTSGSGTDVIYLEAHGILIDLSQRFSLIILGSVTDFKLDQWSLSYDARPEKECFLYIPPNNFGSPSKKRIRTLPMVIDTLGGNVTYQPIVDHQLISPTSIFRTQEKQTVYHLFQTDVFGVDYGGTLEQVSSNRPFEFYGLMTPVSVEELPPPKLFDQIGPYAFDKKCKIYGFRVRMVSFTTSISYTIYGDDVAIHNGTFATIPNIDTTYEVLRLPPGLIANVVRIEFSSPDDTAPFMRFYVQIRVTVSGMQTDEKWVTIAGQVNANQ